MILAKTSNSSLRAIARKPAMVLRSTARTLHALDAPLDRMDATADS